VAGLEAPAFNAQPPALVAGLTQQASHRALKVSYRPYTPQRGSQTPGGASAGDEVVDGGGAGSLPPFNVPKLSGLSPQPSLPSAFHQAPPTAVGSWHADPPAAPSKFPHAASPSGARRDLGPSDAPPGPPAASNSSLVNIGAASAMSSVSALRGVSDAWSSGELRRAGLDCQPPLRQRVLVQHGGTFTRAAGGSTGAYEGGDVRLVMLQRGASVDAVKAGVGGGATAPGQVRGELMR